MPRFEYFPFDTLTSRTIIYHTLEVVHKGNDKFSLTPFVDDAGNLGTSHGTSQLHHHHVNFVRFCSGYVESEDSKECHRD